MPSHISLLCSMGKCYAFEFLFYSGAISFQSFVSYFSVHHLPIFDRFFYSSGCSCHMRGSRKICQRGSKFDNFFFFSFFLLVNGGIEDPNTAKMGHHQPASETPLKWLFAGGQILAQH